MSYDPNSSISAVGQAIPTSATLVGVSDGVNLRAAYGDTGGSVFVTLKDVLVALRAIFNVLARPLWVDPTTSRIKADVTSITTLTTVTTVASVTNIAGVGGLNPRDNVVTPLERGNWALTVRGRIA